MSAGAGTAESGSKDTSHSSTNQHSDSVGTQTPNNLPQLQAGWNQAGNILGATNNVTPTMAGASEQLTANATPQATSTASAGATAATDFANGAHAVNDANQYLTPTASGAYVNNNNPEFQNVVHQTSLALQPEIDGSMAAAGRYGSGANANAFDTALTNATSNMSFQNYIQQQQNQLAAAGQLSNNNATGTQQQLQGASLTPSTTSNLYTAPTATMTAAYAPLLAYISAITQGNGGGTQTNQGYGDQTTNSKDIQLGVQHGDNASFNFADMMKAMG